MAQGIRQAAQLVVVQPQFSETMELPNVIGESGKSVVGEIEINQIF